MKAVVVEQYAPVDQIELKDVPSPRLEPGQIRIQVEAAGIGFVDGLKIEGRYQTKDPLPFIPGTEFAGIVTEAPGEPGGFRTGMRVMGMTRSGALAEEIVVSPSALHPLPDGVAAEVAASFRANYLTALYALSARATLAPGEQLLVLGAAGGTGIAAVQIGKLLGARVIAAASTPEKREFAQAHGADAVIDYTQAGWRDTFKELTGGHGADVIFDPVGGEISVQASLHRLERTPSRGRFCRRRHPRAAVQYSAAEGRRPARRRPRADSSARAAVDPAGSPTAS